MEIKDLDSYEHAEELLAICNYKGKNPPSGILQGTIKVLKEGKVRKLMQWLWG